MTVVVVAGATSTLAAVARLQPNAGLPVMDDQQQYLFSAVLCLPYLAVMAAAVVVRRHRSTVIHILLFALANAGIGLVSATTPAPSNWEVVVTLVSCSLFQTVLGVVTLVMAISSVRSLQESNP